MPGLFFSRAKPVQIGVDFLPTGVAVVEVSSRSTDRGSINRSAFLPAVGMQEQATVLRQWVDQNDLKNSPCSSLIARHDVQDFQLEKPAVAESEMMQAILWKIADLVNFDVDSAVVDTYQWPRSSKSPVENINAVVANANVVQTYVDSIEHSGLDLQVIDTHDLVVKNLHNKLDFSDTTASVLQILEQQSLMTIFHEHDLHVARDFKIGYKDIELSGPGDESVYESMVLELQRSMDYFESSYGKGMIRKLFIFPQTPDIERMANYLQNYVPYELDFICLSDQARDSNQSMLDPHCFSAYCAALRGVYL